jgi:hypothetical protein
MDWERLVRELAHVLPAGVWIQNANAADASVASQSSTSTPPSGSTGSTGSDPSLTLQGCAPDQRTVAKTLVRLRELQGATDVKLEHSGAPADAPSATGAPASTPATGGAGGDCGTTNGKANYDFQAVVTFEQPDAAVDKPGTVPARLGGGQ